MSTHKDVAALSSVLHSTSVTMSGIERFFSSQQSESWVETAERELQDYRLSVEHSAIAALAAELDERIKAFADMLDGR